MTFKEFIELNEKRMSAKDKKNAIKARLKRNKTSSGKKNSALKAKCQKKIGSRSNMTCKTGDSTPTKIDKSRSKAVKLGKKR